MGPIPYEAEIKARTSDINGNNIGEAIRFAKTSGTNNPQSGALRICIDRLRFCHPGDTTMGVGNHKGMGAEVVP